MFWAGHGFITKLDATIRRLLFTDTDTRNKWNLDFDTLLQAFQTAQHGKVFPQQIFFIDACANPIFRDFYPTLQAEAAGERFVTSGTQGRAKQFALFAAAEYAVATNLTQAGMGRFSRAVLEELQGQPLWPNMPELTSKIKANFRDQQHLEPVFWSVSLDGGDREVIDTITQNEISNKRGKRICALTMLCTLVALVSVLSGLSVILIRYLGWLQPLELKTLDWLMVTRLKFNPEGTDNRIRIIEITEEDINLAEIQSEEAIEEATNTKNIEEAKLALKSPDKTSVISDEKILELLKKISSSNPSIIGLNVIRDIPKDNPNKYNELIEYIYNSKEIVFPCISYEDPLYPVPGDTLPEKFHGNPGFIDAFVGFTDFPVDSNDEWGRIRRQYISKQPSKGCSTKVSFSYMIAHLYLSKTRNINFSQDNYGLTYKSNNVSGEDINGKFRFLPLYKQQFGGYSSSNTPFLIRQFLLNYRASIPVAKTMTLKEALSDDALDLNNKIVLIGYADSSYARNLDDYLKLGFHITPYSDLSKLETLMPGVHVHAHMISQIISSVLHERPMLYPTPFWIEIIFIFIFSALGGGIVCCYWFASNQTIRKTVSITAVIIFIIPVPIGYILFLKGLWIPILPILVSFSLALGSTYLVLKFRATESDL